MSASEQKRPVLSIKRKPSGLYRKTETAETGGLVDGKDVQGQEAAGESDAVSADVPDSVDSVDSVTPTSPKKKPVYKGPPSFDEALRRHPVGFIRGIPLAGLTGLTGVPKNLSAYYGNQGKAGKNNVRKSKKESSKESEKAGHEK
ncbi:hypothetical protein V0N22_001783 [Salmonella enterica]|nr:hypothetical protein [Salmonella enterica]